MVSVKQMYQLGENLKRPLLFSLILISVDQILKWFFQANFVGKKLLISGKVGFTYVTNPGLWIDVKISDLTIILLQIFVIGVWVMALFLLKNYHNSLRKSILVDIAFAFFTTAIFGNLIIDRILFGHIRDYFILPMGVANLADFCGQIAIIFIIIELSLFPKFRTFLIKGKLSGERI